MTNFVIGLIASLSGSKERIGRGVLRSFEFTLEEQRTRLGAEAPRVELVVADDRGQVFDALRAMQHCADRSCLAVIGPGDSDSFQAIAADARFHGIPLIATLATGSDLGLADRGNFFRFTTPNNARAELLLLQAHRMMPKAKLEVFVLSGAPETYSQSLKRDVLAVAAEHGLTCEVQDFSAGVIDVKLPSKAAAIVICAPSAAAVDLLRHLRRKGANNQAFGFGSNTNFLASDASGLIVVCDLDRYDANPKVRRRLEQFAAKYPVERDPSLPSMNAAGVILSALHELRDELSALPLGEARSRFAAHLASETFDGLFGPLSFTRRGEMAGFEQIVLSRVRKVSGGYTFSALRDREKPIRHRRSSAAELFASGIGIVGAVTGLVGVVQWFFTR